MGNSWPIFSLRLPPDTKMLVEKMSSRIKISQSELVRRAISEYIRSHSEDEWERRAAEVTSRKQERRARLAEPIDGYDTGMQVVTAWETIQNQRREYEKIGIMRRSLYEPWIRRLEGNVESITEDDPDRETLIESFELLIERLRDEMNMMFPEEKG